MTDETLIQRNRSGREKNTCTGTLAAISAASAFAQDDRERREPCGRSAASPQFACSPLMRLSLSRPPSELPSLRLISKQWLNFFARGDCAETLYCGRDDLLGK
jgi:hypothetical protein